MASFLVLLKKEMRGNVRTHKLLIVTALFLVLGMATPLLLKYLHVLVPAGEEGIVIPEFTAAEVVEGYLDSIGQFGLVAAILVAMGSVSRERESGTAAMTLSKPVGSGRFLAAKLVGLALVFVAAIAAGAAGCYVYTMILFEAVSVWHFLLANAVAGLYLLTCLAVTVMCSSFFKNHLAAAGLALGILIGMIAISAVPAAKEYSPGSLVGWAEGIASGSGPNTWGALGVGIVVVVLSATIGWLVFRRKEL